MIKPFWYQQVRSAHAGSDDWVIIDAEGIELARTTTKERAELIAISLNRQAQQRIAGVS